MRTSINSLTNYILNWYNLDQQQTMMELETITKSVDEYQFKFRESNEIIKSQKYKSWEKKTRRKHNMKQR